MDTPTAGAPSRLIRVNHGPALGPSDRGDEVRRLQRLLVMLDVLPYIGITGRYDQATAYAVRSLQTDLGLDATGEVDEDLWAELPADPVTPPLVEGAEGEVVAALQAALSDVRGPGEDTDPGPADGIFGPNTRLAVQAYQRDRSLDETGEVDDATWWVPANADGTNLARLAQLVTG
jgi:peptidoglycan hydrolase-like protein with peptidoglycan-binding domain